MKDKQHVDWRDVTRPDFFRHTRNMTQGERAAYINDLTRGVLRGMGYDESAHEAAKERFDSFEDWKPGQN